MTPSELQSGRADSNRRPAGLKPSTPTGLSYAPFTLHGWHFYHTLWSTCPVHEASILPPAFGESYLARLARRYSA